MSSAAEWALAHITDLGFQADAGRWREWARAERGWFQQNALRLRDELRDPAAEIAIRALGEVSSHRWRRHELALEAGSALENESPLVRRLTCLTLARLGSSAAGPALERALQDEDESVVRAAQGALDALGLSSPASEHAQVLPSRPRQRT